MLLPAENDIGSTKCVLIGAPYSFSIEFRMPSELLKFHHKIFKMILRYCQKKHQILKHMCQLQPAVQLHLCRFIEH